MALSDPVETWATANPLGVSPTSTVSTTVLASLAMLMTETVSELKLAT